MLTMPIMLLSVIRNYAQLLKNNDISDSERKEYELLLAIQAAEWTAAQEGISLKNSIRAMLLMLQKETGSAWLTVASGLCIMALAVPVYNVITEKRRKRFAPEIIKLSDEIEKDPSV